MVKKYYNNKGEPRVCRPQRRFDSCVEIVEAFYIHARMYAYRFGSERGSAPKVWRGVHEAVSCLPKTLWTSTPQAPQEAPGVSVI